VIIIHLDNTYSLIECLNISCPRSLLRARPSAVTGGESPARRAFDQHPIHRPIRCGPSKKEQKLYCLVPGFDSRRCCQPRLPHHRPGRKLRAVPQQAQFSPAFCPSVDERSTAFASARKLQLPLSTSLGIQCQSGNTNTRHGRGNCVSGRDLIATGWLAYGKYRRRRA
jgi:hypothetical protein